MRRRGHAVALLAAHPAGPHARATGTGTPAPRTALARAEPCIYNRSRATDSWKPDQMLLIVCTWRGVAGSGRDEQEQEQEKRPGEGRRHGHLSVSSRNDWQSSVGECEGGMECSSAFVPGPAQEASGVGATCRACTALRTLMPARYRFVSVLHVTCLLCGVLLAREGSPTVLHGRDWRERAVVSVHGPCHTFPGEPTPPRP